MFSKILSKLNKKTDLWYEKKKHIITATEVSTILNQNKFQSIHQLYHNKIHPDEVVQKTSDSMAWVKSMNLMLLNVSNNDIRMLMTFPRLSNSSRD